MLKTFKVGACSVRKHLKMICKLNKKFVMSFSKNNQLNFRNKQYNWFDNKVNQVKQLQTLFKNH